MKINLHIDLCSLELIRKPIRRTIRILARSRLDYVMNSSSRALRGLIIRDKKSRDTCLSYTQDHPLRGFDLNISESHPTSYTRLRLRILTFPSPIRFVSCSHHRSGPSTGQTPSNSLPSSYSRLTRRSAIHSRSEWRNQRTNISSKGLAYHS